jgi:sodium/potassium-transporting ATPase subunit alpha
VSVTLSLLLIAMRMKKSRVLVKNLTVIETLSCVNVIASDKTGTLTQNKMFVASAVVGTEEISLNDASGSNFVHPIGFKQLVASAGLCNNAAFEDEEKSIPIKQRKTKGDATDTALLKFSAEYESYNDLDKSYDIEAEIPFNSRNKWMVKVIKPKSREIHAELYGDHADFDSSICLLKGAPDYLMKKSSSIIRSDGSSVPITSEVQNQIIQIQNNLCLLGQRVLILCKKECKLDNVLVAGKDSSSDLEAYIHASNDFCIVGLVGIIDPPREGIADVITKCKRAGIRVFMVTGDYALTAAAIATQIGILTQAQYDTVETMRVKHKEENSSYDSSALLLTGNDLDNFTPEDWRLVTPYKEIVFARTTPEQKLRTVKGNEPTKFYTIYIIV